MGVKYFPFILYTVFHSPLGGPNSQVSLYIIIQFVAFTFQSLY